MSQAMTTLKVTRAEAPPGLRAIPVRTRLVRPGDPLDELVAGAVAGIARSGDVIAVSETALAIAQGEFVVAEHVRPSRLAYFICRYAGPLATMSQPESVQLVVERVGAGRIIYASLAHLLGRCFGRRGVFYQLVGDAIAAFDGYTGTMPPYERAIVLAPRRPDLFARSVRERTGVACAVVDANDLDKAKVLGASSGVCIAGVERALLDNPHGNSDEQTPIVVLKWRGDSANPLLAERAP
jgi:F420-0:Gamma-glutamyl ligase